MPRAHSTWEHGERMRGVIIRLVAERPLPFTVAELSKELGISTTSVRQHLNVLKTQGLVDWIPNASRTLHLTPAGKEAAAA